MKIRFIKVPFHIIDKDLTARELQVYVLARSYANSQGERCFPSLAEIAYRCGCSVPTIFRAMRILRDKKLLSWQRGKKGRSNMYTFHDQASELKTGHVSSEKSVLASEKTKLDTYNNTQELDNDYSNLGFELK